MPPDRGRSTGARLSAAPFALALALGLVPAPAEAAGASVYMSPACGCCGDWVGFNGFEPLKEYYIQGAAMVAGPWAGRKTPTKALDLPATGSSRLRAGCLRLGN